MQRVLMVVACLLVCSVAFPMDAEKPSKGWLGVTLMQEKKVVDDEIEKDTGIKILSVMDDSPAYEAGLESKDVIIRLDGRDVSTLGELMGYLEGTQPGDAVGVVVLRDGVERSFDVELGEWPESRAIEFKALKGLKHLKGLHHIVEGECCESHEFKEVSRGFLGVHVQDLTAELRQYFGADEDRGILVAKVLEDTPAANYGLEVGDVILAINGKDMRHTWEVQKAIGKLKQGDEARLTILRRQNEMDVPVMVDEKKSEHMTCCEEEE